MPSFKMVPVENLEPPDTPMRQESIMEGMEGLVADIASQGLLNPLTVRDLQDGRYKIIAGHRRSIAVTILKWPSAPAMVYQPDEGSDDQIMAAENLHRTQVNPKEEALMYKRLLADEKIGTDAIAMRLNVPQSRIENLLLVADGDADTLEALGAGAISVAQAQEINRFETDAYRRMALEQAAKYGLKADGLRRWRQEVKRGGGEQMVEDALASLKTMAPAAVTEPMQICVFGNHSAPLRLSRHYIICTEHWDLIIQALEVLQKKVGSLDGGEGSRQGET